MNALLLSLVLSRPLAAPTLPVVSPVVTSDDWLGALQERLVRTRIDVCSPVCSTELFHGLLVRQANSMLPSGVLAGRLLGWRFGVEVRGFSGYMVAGGGTFNAFRHQPDRREANAVVTTTRSLPYGFVGVGAELRLLRSVLAAAEFDWGRVVTRDRGVLAPDPDELVSTAMFALRIAY